MAEDSGYRDLVRAHERTFGGNRYVYPVLSRRSGGVSIGVNLSPDLACSFRCVYCQVHREPCAQAESIDLARLGEELDRTVELVVSGRIFQKPESEGEGVDASSGHDVPSPPAPLPKGEGRKFWGTPVELRRLNDIALSGNGEPTLCGQFEQVVEVCADARRRYGLDDVKLVLITNATLLDEERVQQGLKILDANHGEIWAKLDAGTEDYYRRVARSEVPFQRILDNLTQAAQARPIVIQTLFMRLEGQPPSIDEVLAYCDRLSEITAAGGQIKLVQVHTVARAPAENWVTALPDDELAALGDLVRGKTGLDVAVYSYYT
ncbi:MAG: radical SAM protein [Pirellulales bacterium]|nr:radical SAM protein [Pirellulales bacterium]